MSDKINFETTVFFPQTQSSCHKIYRSCFDSLSWTFSHSHNFFISVTDIIFFTVFSSFPGRFTCKFRRVFVPWRVVDFNWYVNWQLLTDEVIGLTENRWAEMKRMGFLWQAFPSPQPPHFFSPPTLPFPDNVCHAGYRLTRSQPNWRDVESLICEAAFWLTVFCSSLTVKGFNFFCLYF